MADVLAAIGKFRLRDGAALERWLLAHDLRHAEYNKYFKLRGSPLRGPIDGNWMLRHQLQHVALAKATRDRLANTAALKIPAKWQTEWQLAAWRLPHDQMHQQIEGVIAHGG